LMASQARPKSRRLSRNTRKKSRLSRYNKIQPAINKMHSRFLLLHLITSTRSSSSNLSRNKSKPRRSKVNRTAPRQSKRMSPKSFRRCKNRARKAFQKQSRLQC
jgi:hypothetical protein